MLEVLFWIYLVNSVLLINHEIESAYRKEWKLFGLPGGITGFLLIHFPLLFFILYGLILVYQQTITGLLFSLVVSFFGVFAFTIHFYFIKKGRNEFNTPISLAILISTLIASMIQATLTIYSLYT